MPAYGRSSGGSAQGGGGGGQAAWPYNATKRPQFDEFKRRQHARHDEARRGRPQPDGWRHLPCDDAVEERGRRGSGSGSGSGSGRAAAAAAAAVAATAASAACSRGGEGTREGARVFSVRDFGAKGDNQTDDTAAFEGAIAAAAAAGGGQLLVPRGGVYVIRPINLTSSLEFYIQGGATVAGLADVSAWPVIQAAPSYGQGRDHVGPRHTSLLHGEHLSDVTIRGDGASSVLDGRGPYWWARHKARRETYTRGHLIELIPRRVATATSDEDSPFERHLDCDGVRARRTDAPDDSPNTDGGTPTARPTC